MRILHGGLIYVVCDVERVTEILWIVMMSILLLTMLLIRFAVLAIVNWLSVWRLLLLLYVLNFLHIFNGLWRLGILPFKDSSVHQIDWSEAAEAFSF